MSLKSVLAIFMLMPGSLVITGMVLSAVSGLTGVDMYILVALCAGIGAALLIGKK